MAGTFTFLLLLIILYSAKYSWTSFFLTKGTQLITSDAGHLSLVEDISSEYPSTTGTSSTPIPSSDEINALVGSQSTGNQVIVITNSTVGSLGTPGSVGLTGSGTSNTGNTIVNENPELIRLVTEEEPINVFQNGIEEIRLNLRMLQHKMMESRSQFDQKQRSSSVDQSRMTRQIDEYFNEELFMKSWEKVKDYLTLRQTVVYLPKKYEFSEQLETFYEYYKMQSVECPLNETAVMITEPCFKYVEAKVLDSYFQWDPLTSQPYLQITKDIFVNGDYFSETDPRSYSKIELMLNMEAVIEKASEDTNEWFNQLRSN